MGRIACTCLCLLLPAFAAHAAAEGRETVAAKPLPVAPDQAGYRDRGVAPATGAPENARRSRMVAAESKDRPQMRFSAMYREVGTDPGTRDNCLKGTGSRVRRETYGVGACVIGNGQVYKVEH